MDIGVFLLYSDREGVWYIMRMTVSIDRLTALLLAAALLVFSCASCRSTTEEADDTSKTVLTVMSWNDDFRHAMETYYLPRHAKEMANVEIRWVSDEIVGYRQNVENRLLDGEVIDLFVGDDQMAPFFANNPGTATLAQLGITEADLAAQYPYTRLLGSDADGVQRGSAMNAEPGILLYRADYAAQYLDVTRPEQMALMLSSWDTFLETARTLGERSGGNVRMLSDSSEIWRAIDGEMTGQWVTDGQLSVDDDTLNRWLTYVKSLNSAKGLAGVKPFDDDWQNAVSDGVFCFFAAPWLNKSVASDNADITTLFTTAKKGGVSFGKFKTAPAPHGFVYGGNWLYSSANSPNHELVGQIVRTFTCDDAFMRLLALGNMEFVNHSDVIEELSSLEIANPLFDGLDAFSVYHRAAMDMSLAAPSVYDSTVSTMLYNQAKACAQGKVTQENAVYNFRNNVWKKYDTLTDQPQKPDQTQATQASQKAVG